MGRLSTLQIGLLGGVLTFGLVSGAAAQPDYRTLRTPFGAPDMQGIWSNTSITTLERPANLTSLVISEAQAAELEGRAIARNIAGDAPTDPNAPKPPVGRDPGGYNNAFWDMGTKVGRIRGQLRSSWLVEPADGKLPYTPEAREAVRKQYAAVRAAYDNPEERAPAERCIIGYGSTAGPPMLNVGYNNNYQIVQTKDHVVILVEMMHDARIVRMDSREHAPPHIRPWMGDSVGWYEGDTLVVETTNFNPSESLRISGAFTYLVSPDGKVTERFTRVAPNELIYQFTVDDPKTFTQPWRAEMAMNATPGPIYEYACAEGNRSLEGILAGARQDEQAGRKPLAADGE